MNESEQIRKTALTPALEADARRLHAKPSQLDVLVCALLNALDDSRKALAKATIENDEMRTRDADVYQRQALTTAIYPGQRDLRTSRYRSLVDAAIARAYVALKMNGEAGEVAEEIGKAMRDDQSEITPDRRVRIVLELGDLLWYVAAMCTELDVTLSDVMRANLAKLADRKARGVLGGSGSSR